MRLFLCDDNAEYRTLARLVFERSGHEIVGEAGDGRAAIETVADAEPDVVLLDLNMPGLNGFEALPELARRVPRARILILTTGHAPHERDAALDTGAHGFIVKPERVFELDAELRMALARGR